MDCDLLNEALFLRSTLLVHLNRLEFGQGSQAIVANQLPKDRVQTIEMRRFVKQNKELGSIRPGTFVGHGNDTTGVVFQRRPDLVLKWPAPNGLATLWVVRRWVCWPASLDHEVWDQTMKGREVIVSRGAQREKVLPRGLVMLRRAGWLTLDTTHLGRFGDALAKDLYFEIAKVGMQCHRHDGRRSGVDS